MTAFFKVIGFILVIVGLGLSGVMGSGNRIRANYTNEETEDKLKRLKISGVLIIVGIIILLIGYW